MDLGSIWGRSGVDLGLIWGRSGINLRAFPTKDRKQIKKSEKSKISENSKINFPGIGDESLAFSDHPSMHVQNCILVEKIKQVFSIPGIF